MLEAEGSEVRSEWGLKRIQVGVRSVLGFLGKHRCFRFDAGSYRKPVKGNSRSFWISHSSWMALRGRPARSELQKSNLEMTRD